MHIYYTPDGKPLPSVTTILHILGSDALMKWANIMGFKHQKYEDLMEKSSSFGTIMHSYLQAIVDPEKSAIMEARNPIEKYEIDKALTRFKAVIKPFKHKTVFTEKTIISEELGYAGTLDWLTYLSDHLFLCDFKTSKAPRLHMFLQLGGYHNLLKTIGFNDIEGAAIMIVNKQTAKLFPISLADLEVFGDAFNSLAAFYKKNTTLEMNFNYELLAKSTT